MITILWYYAPWSFQLYSNTFSYFLIKETKFCLSKQLKTDFFRIFILNYYTYSTCHFSWCLSHPSWLILNVIMIKFFIYVQYLSPLLACNTTLLGPLLLNRGIYRSLSGIRRTTQILKPATGFLNSWIISTLNGSKNATRAHNAIQLFWNLELLKYLFKNSKNFIN